MDISELNVLFFDTKNYMNSPIIRMVMKHNLDVLKGANIIILKEEDLKKYTFLKQVKWSVNHNFAHPTNELRHYLATQYKNLLYVDADFLISQKLIDDILNEKVDDFIFSWCPGKLSGCLFYSNNYGKGVIEDIYKIHEQVVDEDTDFNVSDVELISKYIPEQIRNDYYYKYNTDYKLYHIGYGKFMYYYNNLLIKNPNVYYTTKTIPITKELIGKYEFLWEIGTDNEYKYVELFDGYGQLFQLSKSEYFTQEQLLFYFILDVDYQAKIRGITPKYIDISNDY